METLPIILWNKLLSHYLFSIWHNKIWSPNHPEFIPPSTNYPRKHKDTMNFTLTTLFASLPPQSKRRPSDRALAVAYLIIQNQTHKRIPFFMGYTRASISRNKGDNSQKKVGWHYLLEWDVYVVCKYKHTKKCKIVI